MTSPKVSVCIPVYNSASYLTDAINSAVVQQYASYEILIVDDCSTDGSSAIVEPYALQYQCIRYIKNASNLGMVANWNRCLELAQGDYIKFLFGDDLFLSNNTIEILANILDREQDVSLVCSFRKLVDGSNTVITERGFTPSGRSVSGAQCIRDCLTAARNFIGEPTVVMFRKEQALRGFDPSYRQMVDLEMWFHLLTQGNIWCEREALSAFRMHSEQQTVVNVNELVHLEETLRLYDSYLPLSGLKLPKVAEQALYYVQCYRIWKGYRCNGVFSQEFAEKTISRYMPLSRFKKLIPLYKLSNPLWKLLLSLRMHNPMRKH